MNNFVGPFVEFNFNDQEIYMKEKSPLLNEKDQGWVIYDKTWYSSLRKWGQIRNCNAPNNHSLY